MVSTFCGTLSNCSIVRFLGLIKDKLQIRRFYSGKLCGRSADTFYTLLGVEQNASRQEIKAAFIRRSKQLHPDRNANNKNSHQEFVKVIDAYRVLRSDTLRKEYDSRIIEGNEGYSKFEEDFWETQAARKPRSRSTARNSMEFGGDNQSYSSRTDPLFRTPECVPVGTADFYGVKGIRKVSNMVMLGVCFLIVLAGWVIHFGTYRLSLVLRRIDVAERSEKNAQAYANIRKRALSADMDNTAAMEELNQWHKSDAKTR